MAETRAGKYGRNLAIWINHTIQELPEVQRGDYRTRFLAELERYSFTPREKGQPRNEGCIHELSSLAEVDLINPEHLAMLVKEGIHLMYQKQTSARVFDAVRRGLLISVGR